MFWHNIICIFSKQKIILLLAKSLFSNCIRFLNPINPQKSNFIIYLYNQNQSCTQASSPTPNTKNSTCPSPLTNNSRTNSSSTQSLITLLTNSNSSKLCTLILMTSRMHCFQNSSSWFKGPLKYSNLKYLSPLFSSRVLIKWLSITTTSFHKNTSSTHLFYFLFIAYSRKQQYKSQGGCKNLRDGISGGCCFIKGQFNQVPNWLSWSCKFILNQYIHIGLGLRNVIAANSYNLKNWGNNW